MSTTPANAAATDTSPLGALLERAQALPPVKAAVVDPFDPLWFRRYWTLGIGFGAHVLVNGLIDSVRETAEHEARSVCAS
jgi:hypothetical protein